MGKSETTTRTMEVPGAQLYYELRGSGLLLLLLGSPMDSTVTSKGQLAHRTAIALAEQLDVSVADFPGSHVGFPGPCARRLRQLLAEA